MGKAVLYVVSIGLAWLLLCALWPYWNQYRMSYDLKAAAIYGTKHSVEETRSFLGKKIKERGFDYEPRDLRIEKDEHNTVRIRLTYRDEIRFLGSLLKDLEFNLEVTERETKEVF